MKIRITPKVNYMRDEDNVEEVKGSLQTGYRATSKVEFACDKGIMQELFNQLKKKIRNRTTINY